MLDIEWPELERMSFSSSSLEVSEQKMFKMGLFQRLRQRLNKNDDGVTVIDIVTVATEEVLKEGWDTLTVDNILLLVEAVIDFVLPYIDLPGPDLIVRPIVKRSILNTARPLAQRLLGIL
jgi:hypothetical protein